MTDTETTEPTTDVEDIEEQPVEPAKTEWKPPTEAEFKAMQARLKKANGEAASHRKQAEEAVRKGETEAETRVREAAEKARTDAEERWRPRYIRQSATAALANAGVVGDVARVLPLLDYSAVQVDEDGELDGLDEQISAVKGKYPEFFAKRVGARFDGGAGTDTTSSGKPTDETARKLIRSLL